MTIIQLIEFFKRMIAYCCLFVVFYLLWTTILFKTLPDNSTKGQLSQGNGLENAETVNLKIDKLDYVRIGAPAAKFGKKFERKSIRDLDLDKAKAKEDQFDGQLRRKNSILHNLPRELPYYIALALSAIIITVKFSLYFSKFSDYKNSLMEQEKLNRMIEYFKSVNTTPSPIYVEEEKTTGSDYPSINEEHPPYSHSQNVSLENTRINVVSESAYPSISPLPEQMTRRH